jgi:hypothetical protein
MSAKVYVQGGRRMFRCPACDDIHQVDGGWSWNDSLDKPTFRPSILVRYFIGDNMSALCHSFVTEGRIAYQGDCTHKFKGQTVELPDWEPGG